MSTYMKKIITLATTITVFCLSPFHYKRNLQIVEMEPSSLVVSLKSGKTLPEIARDKKAGVNISIFKNWWRQRVETGIKP